MSSIFGKDFLSNLQRIQRPSGSLSNGPQQTKSDAEPFARVLGDYENPAKTSSNIKPLAEGKTDIGLAKPAAEPQPPSLTNFNEVEQQLIPKVAHPRAEQAYKQAQLGKMTEIQPELSVKNTIGDVKISSAESAIEGSHELPLSPQTPKMLSAKRLSGRIGEHASGKPLFFNPAEIERIISSAGRYHGVDPELGMAVAQTESSLRVDAVSDDGHSSKGLFQLLDTTARDLLGDYGSQEDYEPFDAGMNAFLGMGYLRQLHDMFSSETRLTDNLSTKPAKSAADLEKLAIAAFNAGQGNVARAQQQAAKAGRNPAEFSAIEAFLPPSTRQYVEKVMEKKQLIAMAEEAAKISGKA